MDFGIQIVLAFLLDLTIGDPERFPHPVRMMGRAAEAMEHWSRRVFPDPMQAGRITAFGLVAGVYGFTWVLLIMLGRIHPLLETLGSIYFIYASLSVRSLYDESLPVLEHLNNQQLGLARKELSNIVGRDTENLNPQEITRATVETVSESAVDGIVSPLFYAVLGGAPLAMAFKGVSTLDSMFGYRNEKYERFGKASARMDDAANWLPARIGGALMAAASSVLGFDGKRAFKTMLRDGQNHLSPNAGIPEAAMAGALGVQLGGVNYYQGAPIKKPAIGDDIRRLEPEDISKSHKIMFVTALLTLFFFLGIPEIFLWVIESNR